MAFGGGSNPDQPMARGKSSSLSRLRGATTPRSSHEASAPRHLSVRRSLLARRRFVRDEWAVVPFTCVVAVARLCRAWSSDAAAAPPLAPLLSRDAARRRATSSQVRSFEHDYRAPGRTTCAERMMDDRGDGRERRRRPDRRWCDDPSRPWGGARGGVRSGCDRRTAATLSSSLGAPSGSTRRSTRSGASRRGGATTASTASSTPRWRLCWDRPRVVVLSLAGVCSSRKDHRVVPSHFDRMTESR